MKPAVVPLAIGFTAGVAAGLSFAEGWLLAPAAGLAAVALWGVRGAMRVVLFMAVGLALGAVHGAAARAARVRDCRLGWADGARVSLEVEPVGLSFGRSRMVRATGECGGQVRIVSRDSLAAGAAVVGTWRRAPVSTLRRLARPDQAGVLMVDSVRNWGPGLSLRSRLRLGAERRLLELFGERRFGVAAALSTSPGIQLDEGEHARYRAAGLAHLLSISGFHVGVLAAALVLVLRAARSSPGGAQLGALGVVALYVWLLGWPAPALRAGVLLAFWTWARLRQRPPDSAGLLAGCALLVLAADAWSVLAPGAWLSFAGAWGCAAAARQLQAVRREVTGRRLRALLRRARPVAISTGAVVATSPFTILFFGGVAPIAVAANLFAVPAAAAAVPALALALALSAVPLLSAGAWVPAGAAGLALDALDVVARAAAAVPGALVPVGPRLSGAVVAATLAVLLLRAVRRPANRGARAQLAGRCALAAALVACWAAWSPVAGWRRGDDPGRLALHFLPVGQGDAVAIRTPLGRWLLVDAGPRTAGRDAGAAVVAPFLRRRGSRRLEVAVLSHGDADHLGGMPAVLRELRPALVLEPGEPLPSPLYREWLETLAARGARWRAARAGDTVELDGVRLVVWHPDEQWLARRLAPNENSVVLTVEYGAFRAVLPGDAGLPMELARGAAIGPVTLLKLGHHGSASATGPSWLASLRPALCVVPVGANRYGHPHPVVLAAVRQAGCAAWRTDTDGLITVVTDGRTVTVRTATQQSTVNVAKETP